MLAHAVGFIMADGYWGICFIVSRSKPALQGEKYPQPSRLLTAYAALRNGQVISAQQECTGMLRVHGKSPVLILRKNLSRERRE